MDFSMDAIKKVLSDADIERYEKLRRRGMKIRQKLAERGELTLEEPLNEKTKDFRAFFSPISFIKAGTPLFYEYLKFMEQNIDLLEDRLLE